MPVEFLRQKGTLFIGVCSKIRGSDGGGQTRNQQHSRQPSGRFRLPSEPEQGGQTREHEEPSRLEPQRGGDTRGGALLRSILVPGPADLVVVDVLAGERRLLRVGARVQTG